MKIIVAILVILCSLQAQAQTNNNVGGNNFATWLQQFEAETLAEGMPADAVENVLALAYENQTVVKLDQKQPEGKISFSQYRSNILSADRIKKGRAAMQQNRQVLSDISAHYGVPANMILALWGVETNYGGYTGNFNIIPSLATLAYEGRRAEFFKAELRAAISMVAEEKIAPKDLLGSWAGAMGQCQFMPSSFRKYAVDWDKDGRKDIWHSLPDTFASIANYLHTEGWNAQLRWGRAVQIPQGMTLDHESLYKSVKLADLAKSGVQLPGGGALPQLDVEGYIMHPGTPDEGAFLVYQNYHVLLHWNKSRYFATAVGLLADAIAEGN
jgi:membrane-bound lytic murein transglycosylase B